MSLLQPRETNYFKETIMRAMLLCGFAVLLTAASAEAQNEAELDPLAELAALGDDAVDTGPEGGGSIRAKKDADLERSQRIRDPKNVEARVEEVKSARFPLAAIKVKVTRPAREGEGKKLKRSETLVLTPVLKFDGKRVDMNDPQTLINASAFYLQKGDRVVFRLSEKKGAHWQAAYIERK